MATQTPQLVVLGENPVVDEKILKALTCNICCSDFDQSNYICYKLSPSHPWCLATSLCSECLEYYLDSQNRKVEHFSEELSCLEHCSRLLKALLRGEYGIPVRLHDPIIFPGLDDVAIPNPTDPQFGRKSEVWCLSIGDQRLKVDPCLPSAPKSQSDVRKLLCDVVRQVSERLRDYEGEVPNSGSGDAEMEAIVELRENLDRLTRELRN